MRTTDYVGKNCAPFIAVGYPGRGPRGPAPPLFLDQTYPLYLRTWMTAPHPLSEGLDPPLNCLRQNTIKRSLNSTTFQFKL